MNVVEVGDVSLNALGSTGMAHEIEITVDSGVGESVINPADLPDITPQPSAGSKRGQQYVGPGGELMNNLGEQVVDLETERGEGAGEVPERAREEAAAVGVGHQ